MRETTRGKPIPPELLQMAKDAIQSLKDREGEDIEEWAKRLAKDVCRADD